MLLPTVVEKLRDHHARSTSCGHQAGDWSPSTRLEVTYLLAVVVIATVVLLWLLTEVKVQGLTSLPHLHPFLPSSSNPHSPLHLR